MAKQRVCIEPQSRWVEVNERETLRDALFREGVEFPCGGKGSCGGCRVRLLEGQVEPVEVEREYFSKEEIEEGWRFACRIQTRQDLRIHLEQWDAPILESHGDAELVSTDGFGVAIDLGTTTIVAQLLDLSTGRVLGVAKSLNPQAIHGSDLMHRIDYARNDAGFNELMQSVRQRIGMLIKQLIEANSIDTGVFARIVVVGNTAMHHLFCGLQVSSLVKAPFESDFTGLQKLTVDQLQWRDMGKPDVWSLPFIGGFVGGDILAGIVATKMHQKDQITLLVDIGTNGEIVLGNRERILCASTAAGPAFEGGGVKNGMYAATGAIDAVEIIQGQLSCHVIGGKSAKGICGSGLVDAVAACLNLGLIEPSGRIASKQKEIALTRRVTITQHDIRQLQLAKGAIAAGIQVLLDEYGIDNTAISLVSLAGAFGNYINVESAIRIGLLPLDASVIKPVGNTALQGAKMVLGYSDQQGECAEIMAIIEHKPLGESATFQQRFIEATQFPE